MFQNLKKPDISLKDIFIIVGACMIGRGLYMIYPPAMWLGMGLFLAWLGLPDKR